MYGALGITLKEEKLLIGSDLKIFDLHVARSTVLARKFSPMGY